MWFLPITPFHYPVALLLSKLDDRFLLLWVGRGFYASRFRDTSHNLTFRNPSIIPIPFSAHSLLGASIIGKLLSMIFVVFIYPFLVNSLFNISKQKVARKCKFSLSLLFSCFLGSISHVLLDFTNQSFNPILWPFSPPILSPICNTLGGPIPASIIVYTLLLGKLMVSLLYLRDNFWEKLLIGK